jgi:DNA (cytosine-5)-methyltransferase 1
MLKPNFYLDSKSDKRHGYPIHLVIRQKGTQVKVSIGEKIKAKYWDKKNQAARPSYIDHKSLNRYIKYLRDAVEKYLEKTTSSQLTDKKIKEKILSIVEGHKAISEKQILHDNEYSSKERIAFIDLFAGAGGFSEGFLQAEYENRIYDFLLASDINENCELTHKVRYNYQLGLEAEFMTQDITEPTFLDNLLKKIDNKTVDVVCGGPPCQSFSLAGKRKKFDKKDDLFFHYLKVIRQLRPKYFVMENVKGILTKEGGKIREMILKEIRSIIDLKEFPQFLSFISGLKDKIKDKSFLIDCYLLRLRFEEATDKRLSNLKEQFIQALDTRFKKLTPKIVTYKTSKTDPSILTIRHGFNLLQRDKELEYIRKKIIHEKAHSDLDNDFFVDHFDQFLTAIDAEAVVEQIKYAFEKIQSPREFKNDVDEIVRALSIYTNTFDDCVEELRGLCIQADLEDQFNQILENIRLYRIEDPFIALASNYGVPQNRERVLFIGCRKDQKLIKGIPPTVQPSEKVTVFEALYDLDFIGNDEEAADYEEVDIEARFNGTSEKMLALLRKRAIDGKILGEVGSTYSEWSKKGRLNERFNQKPPIYVKNSEELKELQFIQPRWLQNHKTSNQNQVVIKRLKIILNEGDYAVAKKKLKSLGLESEKRNYNVLRPDSQSPTIMDNC